MFCFNAGGESIVRRFVVLGPALRRLAGESQQQHVKVWEPASSAVNRGIRHVVAVVPDGDVISSVDEHAGILVDMQC